MNYDIIMRFVKMVTNFARTGYVLQIKVPIWIQIYPLKFQNIFSNPSIEGNTPFESCKSSYEIFCQEFSNEPVTRVTIDIMNQLHYDVWQEIEEIYKSLKDESKKVVPDKEEL